VHLEHCNGTVSLELGPRDLDHDRVAEPDAVADQDRLGLGDGLGHDHLQHEPHPVSDDEPLALKHQDGLGLGHGLVHGQLDALGFGDCDCDCECDLNPDRGLRGRAVL
jgi:hypothetical protein